MCWLNSCSIQANHSLSSLQLQENFHLPSRGSNANDDTSIILTTIPAKWVIHREHKLQTGGSNLLVRKHSDGGLSSNGLATLQRRSCLRLLGLLEIQGHHRPNPRVSFGQGSPVRCNRLRISAPKDKHTSTTFGTSPDGSLMRQDKPQGSSTVLPHV